MPNRSEMIWKKTPCSFYYYFISGYYSFEVASTTFRCIFDQFICIIIGLLDTPCCKCLYWHYQSLHYTGVAFALVVMNLESAINFVPDGYMMSQVGGESPSWWSVNNKGRQSIILACQIENIWYFVYSLASQNRNDNKPTLRDLRRHIPEALSLA